MKYLKMLLKRLYSINSVSLTFDLELAKQRIEERQKDLEPEKIYLA